MKKIDFDLSNNPFINFHCSRYSMSSRIDVKKAYNYSKQNNYSFFLLSLACLIKAANTIPQFKRRIINGEVIEYDSVDGITPIMDEENEIFREMRVPPVDDFSQWHDYVKQQMNEILSNNNPGFTLAMEERDFDNIINFSCIPWVDFESLTTCLVNPNAIQPLISWGKFNEDYKMTVAITVNHIFVNGRELGYFYQNAQKFFKNPEKL